FRARRPPAQRDGELIMLVADQQVERPEVFVDVDPRSKGRRVDPAQLDSIGAQREPRLGPSVLGLDRVRVLKAELDQHWDVGIITKSWEVSAPLVDWRILERRRGDGDATGGHLEEGPS